MVPCYSDTLQTGDISGGCGLLSLVSCCRNSRQTGTSLETGLICCHWSHVTVTLSRPEVSLKDVVCSHWSHLAETRQTGVSLETGLICCHVLRNREACQTGASLETESVVTGPELRYRNIHQNGPSLETALICRHWSCVIVTLTRQGHFWRVWFAVIGLMLSVNSRDCL